MNAEVARKAGVNAFDLAELIESGMPEAWFQEAVLPGPGVRPKVVR